MLSIFQSTNKEDKCKKKIMETVSQEKSRIELNKQDMSCIYQEIFKMANKLGF